MCINAAYRGNRAKEKFWQESGNLFTQGTFIPPAQVSNRSQEDEVSSLWDSYLGALIDLSSKKPFNLGVARTVFSVTKKPRCIVL